MESEFYVRLREKLVDVGHPGFNSAHKRLLDIIIDADRILSAVLFSGRPPHEHEWEELAIIFDDLIAYTKVHFNEEVEYLYQQEYPNADHHQAVHDGIVNQLSQFLVKIQIFKDASSIAVTRRWLLEWLLNHVNQQDADYARYFAERKMGSRK
jgi:hemerythrin